MRVMLVIRAGISNDDSSSNLIMLIEGREGGSPPRTAITPIHSPTFTATTSSKQTASLSE